MPESEPTAKAEEHRDTDSRPLLFGGMITRSPAAFLIMLGCMGVYLVALSGNFRADTPSGAFEFSNTTLVQYSALAFSFMLAIAGIFMLFAQLKRGGSSLADEPTLVTTSDLEHALSQLGKNYDIQRRQANQGFIFAVVMMGLGILVILAGSVGQMYGLTKEGSGLTVIAGLVVEVVSGLGLYLFRETFRQLNTTSDRLHDTWKIFAAFKRAEAITDEAKRTEVITTLITRLVEPAAPYVPPDPPPAVKSATTNAAKKKGGK
jgi:hypothetical protein